MERKKKNKNQSNRRRRRRRTTTTRKETKKRRPTKDMRTRAERKTHENRCTKKRELTRDMGNVRTTSTTMNGHVRVPRYDSDGRTWERRILGRQRWKRNGIETSCGKSSIENCWEKKDGTRHLTVNKSSRNNRRNMQDLRTSAVQTPNLPWNQTSERKMDATTILNWTHPKR